MSDNSRLLELLSTLAYEKRDNITLASGQSSGHYVDCKQVALTGEGHVLLGEAFYKKLQEVEGDNAFEALGGMSMGADPLCSATSVIAFQNGRTLNAIYVRKEAKGHGTGAYLEGLKTIPDGARVVVLEDVVTSGGSSLKAVQRLRDGGFVVDTVLTIVDRQQGGTEKLASEGLTLHSLYTLEEVIAAAAG